MEQNQASQSLFNHIAALKWPFWVVNIMEMIERLAYYGVRVVIPIYIAQADEVGGLHFSQHDKGFIFMAWAFVQSALPVFTGGFADRYGYKKQIAIAIVIKMAGYVLMATQRTFWPFFLGCMVLATGTAIFKPPIQGTMAKTLNKDISGTGWGVFYMVVNVGGFIGPPVAHFLYGYSWPCVFYGCALIVSLNALWLFSYKSVDSGADKTGNAWNVISDTFKNLFNFRLILFILIMSALWACFTQLWDMLPNFIVDWIDSSSLAERLPPFMSFLLSKDTSRGPQITQEWVINLNPFLIIFLVAPISWYVNRKMRRLSSIFLGITFGSIGILTVGASMSIFVCLAGIFIFSIGEMLSSPKMNEYLAVLAPKDKKGLFMGYANIPFAIGWSYGAILGGHVYENMGEKATLALRYLSDEMHVIVPRTKAFAVLCEKLEKTPAEGTLFLWNQYGPWSVWVPFAVIGICAAIGMLIFGYYCRRWKKYNL